MHKSSLFEIIRTYSKDDIAKFDDFIKSPYHNKNSNAIKLFAVIKKYTPDLNDDKLTKEESWKIIFPAKNYNYGIMKNLIHDLTKLSENYLSQITSKRNFVYNKNLIEELRNRNLLNMHKKALDKLSEKIDKLPKDEDYYGYKIMLIQEELYTNIDKKLNDKLKVDSVNQNLNLFMIRFFTGALNLFIEEQRTSIRHDNKTTLYFLDYFEKNLENFKNEKILLIYYHLLKAAINLDNDNDYSAVRNTVKKNLSVLDYTEKRNIYNAFITICLKKKSFNPAKGADYQAEITKLCIEMIQLSLLGDEGTDRVDILIYRNILVWYLYSKEKKALREFIHKYSSKVITTSREIIENYSKAFLCFVNEDFKKCLEYCARISFGELLDTARESFWFKNDIKSLEIRCFYELDLFENLITAGDSYKHFLTSTLLMNDTSREGDMNFNKQLQELFILKIDRNIHGIRELNKTILSFDNISNKAWLLEKIEELEKKNC